MEIIWHGYACFSLVSGGYTLLLDPYRPGTLAGFPPLSAEADEVLCSHGHDGHGAVSAVRLRRGGAASPFAAEGMETYHRGAEDSPPRRPGLPAHGRADGAHFRLRRAAHTRGRHTHDRALRRL